MSRLIILTTRDLAVGYRLAGATTVEVASAVSVRLTLPVRATPVMPAPAYIGGENGPRLADPANYANDLDTAWHRIRAPLPTISSGAPARR